MWQTFAKWLQAIPVVSDWRAVSLKKGALTSSDKKTDAHLWLEFTSIDSDL